MLIQKEWVALAHPFATRLSGLRNGRCDDEMVSRVDDKKNRKRRSSGEKNFVDCLGMKNFNE